jgi:hypothetical protein
MVSTMVKATTLVLETWEAKYKMEEVQLNWKSTMRMNIITLNVMAHTIFGNNYKEAQQMFEQMETLLHILMQAFKNPNFLVPRYRFFLPLLQISSRFYFSYFLLCKCLSGPPIAT